VLNHRIPIDDFQRGFDVMAQEACGKVACERGR